MRSPSRFTINVKSLGKWGHQESRAHFPGIRLRQRGFYLLVWTVSTRLACSRLSYSGEDAKVSRFLNSAGSSISEPGQCLSSCSLFQVTLSFAWLGDTTECSPGWSAFPTGKYILVRDDFPNSRRKGKNPASPVQIFVNLASRVAVKSCFPLKYFAFSWIPKITFQTL